jgi:hypothetical protein
MKLLKSETAAAEVVGHAILLSITILGISMIMLYGVPAIYSLQDMANVKNVEQAYTVLDSRASRVTLGESQLQITDINLDGGSLTVEPNSTQNPSYMVVKSENNTFNVTLPMGKVRYQLGDRIVAYEDGGVWSKYPSGSVMLSPPEFHYNGVTLTLPVFNFSGNASVGGKGTAAVSIKKKSTIIRFPNTSGNVNMTNAVNYNVTGKVYVIIHSDYYDAWANFASSSDYMRIAKNIDGPNTVNITLTVVPPSGSHPLVPPIRFRGINPDDPNPLDGFYFNLTDVGNQFQMDLRAPTSNCNIPSSTACLHIQAQKDGGMGNYGITITVQYSENNKIEEFKTDVTGAINPATNTANIDLLNSSLPSTYTSHDTSWTPWNPAHTYNQNDPGPPLYNVTQHYAQLMAERYGGSFDLFGGTRSGDKNPTDSQWPGDGSTYTLIYDAHGGITYLHITDNKADVGIN